MYILATLSKKTVYLLIIILTMGGCHSAYCEENTAISRKQNSMLMYNILIAEIAASRHMNQVALHYYSKAIKETKDPSVAEAATLLAISLEAPHEALLSAEHWVKEDPLNLQAQLVTLTLLIGTSIERSLPYLTKIIELDPEQRDNSIMEIQSRLSNQSAKNLKKALNIIAESRSTDPYAKIIAAESAIEQRDIKSAIYWVDSALILKPHLTRAIQLKARLICYQKNSDTPAIAYLKNQLDKFPNDNELRFFYASALLDTNNIDNAKQELQKLSDDSKYGGSTLLLLADIYIKEKDINKALNAIKKAQSFTNASHGAEFLLGEIEELRGDSNKAIERYSKVDKGPYQIPAVLRAIALLKETHNYQEAIHLIHNSSPITFEEQKQLLLTEIELLNANKESDAAMQLASDILSQLPNDEDILLMRAITAANLENWDIAENDLKQIITQNPSNTNALSALETLKKLKDNPRN